MKVLFSKTKLCFSHKITTSNYFPKPSRLEKPEIWQEVTKATPTQSWLQRCTNSHYRLNRGSGLNCKYEVVI